MLDKILFAYHILILLVKNLWEKVGENTFNMALLLGSMFFYFTAYSGEDEAVKVLALIFVKIAVYLNISDIYIYFLGTTGRKINSEVFDQNNSASAIYISGFRVALAISLLQAI